MDVVYDFISAFDRAVEAGSQARPKPAQARRKAPESNIESEVNGESEPVLDRSNVA